MITYQFIVADNVDPLSVILDESLIFRGEEHIPPALLYSFVSVPADAAAEVPITQIFIVGFLLMTVIPALDPSYRKL